MKDLYLATRAFLYPGDALHAAGPVLFQVEGVPLLTGLALSRFERLNRGHQHLLNTPLMAFDNRATCMAAGFVHYRPQETLGRSTAGLVRGLVFDKHLDDARLCALRQAQDTTGWIEFWTVHQIPLLDQEGQELLQRLGFDGEVRLRMLSSFPGTSEASHARYVQLNIHVLGRVYNLVRRLDVGEYSLASLHDARAMITRVRQQMTEVLHEFASHPDAQPYRNTALA